jgi:sensor histidine kinase YesM
LAEESGTPVFAEMCYKLISMMRYITLPDTQATTIEQEINHTQAYLELMKLRYESGLSYYIEVAPHLSHLTLPKLTIQPIVENSFKHAFSSVLPPWEIYVKVQSDPVESDGWHIVISDNGSGFDPEILSSLQEMIAHLQMGQFGITDPPLKKSVHHGGLGLMNSLARSKLFFGSQITFTIENLSPGMIIDIYICHRKGVSKVV